MAKSSRSGKRGATPTLDALRRSSVPAGFLDAWNRLVAGWDVPTLPRRRGRKPRVPVRDLLPALTLHVLNEAGTLSEHFSELFDAPLADSSWADRRARLPWAIHRWAGASPLSGGLAATRAPSASQSRAGRGCCAMNRSRARCISKSYECGPRISERHYD